MENSHIRVTNMEGVAILSVKGNLDTRRSMLLEERLAAVSDQGVANVLIDMEEGGYIGSACIETLMRGANRCRMHGGSLRVCGVSPGVRDVFAMLGLDRVLPIYEDRHGALLEAPASLRERMGVRDRRTRPDRRTSALPFTGAERRKNTRRLLAHA